MDNSIFILPTVCDENPYADEEMNIGTFVSVPISEEVGWINKVFLVVAGTSYELSFSQEYEYCQKKYSVFNNLVYFHKVGNHQEAFIIADVADVGRIESPHFFIDIERFF